MKILRTSRKDFTITIKEEPLGHSIHNNGLNTIGDEIAWEYILPYLQEFQHIRNEVDDDMYDSLRDKIKEKYKKIME